MTAHHLGGSGDMPPPPRKVLAFRSSEIDFDAIWANLGGKSPNHFHLFFYDKEL